MTQTAINYAKALFELNIPEPDLKETDVILRDNAELLEVLCNPAVKANAKHNIIDKIFPKSTVNYLKLLSDNGSVPLVFEIFEHYKALAAGAVGRMEAELIFCDEPSEEQLRGIREKLLKRYGKKEIDLKLTRDKSILGGFIIKVGGEEIDYSIRGRIEGLSQRLIRR